MLQDLNYKVIVIDDEQLYYDDYVDEIKSILDEQGYLLIHERYEELTDLEENNLSDVDLFLVDLKFGNEDRGIRFISKIRENYYTDILFYSSDAKAINDCRSNGEFEGVFFAVRDENTREIKEKIKLLVYKMIKRSNTPLSSRGIVLGCVAEIDTIIKGKIRALMTNIGSEQADRLMNECTRLYYDSFNGTSVKIKEFFGTEFHSGKLQWNEVKDRYLRYDISELIDNLDVTDSNKNFRVFLKIYEILKGKDEFYNIAKGFINLLSDRNILAHVPEEKNKDGIYQLKRRKENDYLVLSEEKCIELRTSIVQYYSLISGI